MKFASSTQRRAALSGLLPVWWAPGSLHEPFDPTQAAQDAFGQQDVPDAASAVSDVAANMVGPVPRADHLIIAGALRRCSGEPDLEAAFARHRAPGTSMPPAKFLGASR